MPSPDKHFTVAGTLAVFDPLTCSGVVETGRFGSIPFGKDAIDHHLSELLSIGSKVALMATATSLPNGRSYWHVTYIGLLKDARYGLGRVVDRHEKFGFLECLSGSSGEAARVFFPGAVLVSDGLTLRDLTKLLRNGDIVQYSAVYNPCRSVRFTEASYTAFRVNLVYHYSAQMSAGVGIVQQLSALCGSASMWIHGIGNVVVPKRVLAGSGITASSLSLGDRVRIAFGPDVGVTAADSPRFTAVGVIFLGNDRAPFLLGGAEEGFIHAEASDEQLQLLNEPDSPDVVTSIANAPTREQSLLSVAPFGGASLNAGPSRSLSVAPSSPSAEGGDKGTYFGVGIIGTLSRRYGFFWSPDCGLTFFRTFHCPEVQRCLYEKFRSLDLVKFEAKYQEPVGACCWQATSVELLDSSATSGYERFKSFVCTKGRVMPYSGKTGFIETVKQGTLSFTAAEIPLRTKSLEEVLPVGEKVSVVAYPSSGAPEPASSYRVFCFPGLQDFVVERWKSSKGLHGSNKTAEQILARPDTADSGINIGATGTSADLETDAESKLSGDSSPVLTWNVGKLSLSSESADELRSRIRFVFQNLTDVPVNSAYMNCMIH